LKSPFIASTSYYSDKLESLKDIFGSSRVELGDEGLIVDQRVYPIVDDVIILLDQAQYPPGLRDKLKTQKGQAALHSPEFAEDIQFTFGEEWQRFPKILTEHSSEVLQYFDLVDLQDFKDLRVCDLGCGIGRWSYFLTDKCRELILVDFSDAIFVARNNLRDSNNCLFFMGDLKNLPFRNDFADFLFCLGVLHHLPTPAIDEVVALRHYAPDLLIYLYYALDNRPFYFRLILALVSRLRLIVANSRNPKFRQVFTWLAAVGIYLPLITLGSLLRPFGVSRYVPLYEFYRGRSLDRIRQDVYDRFFTRLEQRHSRKEITVLENVFAKVVVSENMPYWHFVCFRNP
jgi:SAM-dependent methyltransferase